MPADRLIRPIGSVELLERAITFTRGSLALVTASALGRPTPCPDWDLRALLWHVHDSLLALQEAADVGDVGLAATRCTGDPITTVRDRATALLGAWTTCDGPRMSIAGCPVTTHQVAGAGAVEIAVHGWDIARACGERRPIPDCLAAQLLTLTTTLVTDADRPGRFAPPIPVAADADAGDRLVAFLGRRP